MATLLSFSGTNNFISNSARNVGADAGGAIYAYSNAVLSFNGSNYFISNSADYSGGAIQKSGTSVLTVDGTTNFVNNSARNGGAIFADTNSTLRFKSLLIIIMDETMEE